jgi:hypothetical protein
MVDSRAIKMSVRTGGQEFEVPISAVISVYLLLASVS